MFSKQNISQDYLFYRKQVLEYTNDDMNLKLENDNQVYIALFDIPFTSSIIGNQTISLALVFGLNTHIYYSNGKTITGLEISSNVKKAMQSLLISSHQLLPYMSINEDIEFHNSQYIRVYLKTKKGIHYKELKKESKENDFIKMMMNHVLKEVMKSDEFKQIK